MRRNSGHCVACVLILFFNHFFSERKSLGGRGEGAIVVSLCSLPSGHLLRITGSDALMDAVARGAMLLFGFFP